MTYKGKSLDRVLYYGAVALGVFCLWATAKSEGYLVLVLFAVGGACGLYIFASGCSACAHGLAINFPHSKRADLRNALFVSNACPKCGQPRW